MAYIPPEEEMELWNIPESADYDLNLFNAPLYDGGDGMTAADLWGLDAGLPDESPVASADPAWTQLDEAWKYCQYDPAWQPLSPVSSQASPPVAAMTAPIGLDPLPNYLGAWPGVDDYPIPLPVTGQSSPMAGASFSPTGSASPSGYETPGSRATRAILPKSASPPCSPESESQMSVASTPSTAAAAAGRASPSAQLPCPYPDCGRAFATPGQLRAHEKRHTRPYACKASGCDKRYGAKEDLNRHLCQDHGEVAATLGIRKKERNCSYCSYRSRIDNVKRHERTCSRRPK